MKLNVYKKWLSLIVVLVVVLFCLNYYYHPFSNNNNQIQSVDYKAGIPVRIKIPKLNVDAKIDSVGTTSTGAMDTPKVPANAGWFDLGARPGEKGSAVIAGHYGWKDGIPAVFDNLSKLNIGDVVYIEDDKGTSISFVVRKIKTYDKNGDAAEVFNSTDGKSHLNLITCAGTWDKNANTNSSRLVVFLDLNK